MQKKKARRRPRWGRIFGVLGGFILCIAAIVALPRLLTAPPADGGQSREDSAVSDAASDAVSDAAGQTPAEPATGGVDLRDMRVLPWSSDRSWAASNEKGCFLAIDRDNNLRNLRLAYYDKATNTLRWICSRPDCAHDTPECTAYLEQNGFVVLRTDGEQLFICMGDVAHSTDAPVLYQVDWDSGARRQLLYGDNSETMFALSFLAHNDSSVIYQQGQTLYRYDLQQGSAQPLLSVTGGIRTLCQNVMVTGTIETVEKPEHRETLRYLARDCASGEERALYTEETTGQYLPSFFSGGYLYHVVPTGGQYASLQRMDLVNGQEETVTEQMFFPKDAACRTYRLWGNILEYYIAFPDPQDADNWQEQALLLDLATGQTTRQTTDERLIIAEFDDCLLVQSQALPGRGYAVISKETLWPAAKTTPLSQTKPCDPHPGRDAQKKDV